MSGVEEQGLGRVVAGRYRLESVLGRGGMGVVWSAVDTLIERRVALKELRAPASMAGGEDASFVERSLREARNAGRLSNPGVVAIHDVIAPSEGDDAVYIVMEYVEAPTLGELVDREGPLPVPRVAALGVGILDALGAAHAMGIVHRDVKPANVLVREGDRIKLTDFGIALAAEDARLTRSGVIGTHGYLAPECFDAGQTGPAVDLWALGATLFHAVAGRAPFDRDTPTATLRAILFEDLPAPPCEPALAQVIGGLLTRSVEERLTAASARQLLAPIATAPALATPTADSPLTADPDQAAWEAQATTVNRPPSAAPPPAPPMPPVDPTAQPAWQQPGLPPPAAPPMAPTIGASRAGPSPQPDRTPWILGSVLGGLALLVLVVLVGVSLASDGSDSGDDPDTAASGSYPEATEAAFVGECTNQTGDATVCECTYDYIVQNVPYEEYEAFEVAFSEDSSMDVPDWVEDGVNSCLSASGSVPPASGPEDPAIPGSDADDTAGADGEDLAQDMVDAVNAGDSAGAIDMLCPGSDDQTDIDMITDVASDADLNLDTATAEELEALGIYDVDLTGSVQGQSILNGHVMAKPEDNCISSFFVGYSKVQPPAGYEEG